MMLCLSKSQDGTSMMMCQSKSQVCRIGLMVEYSRMKVPSLSSGCEIAPSQYLGLGLIVLPASILQVAVHAHTEVARKVTVSNSQREVGD